MKKILFFPAVLFLVVEIVLFSACSTLRQVDRVDAETPVDLSGRWNDEDARKVSESLTRDLLGDSGVDKFIEEYSSRHNGELPAYLVREFDNNSSEHIDTSIISRTIEIAIDKSGKMVRVAGGAVRDKIRSERQDQLVYASEETAASIANETGAALLLTGSIKANVDKAGNKTVRSYFVSAELINIEKLTSVWGDNKEIKKVITQSRYQF